MEYLITKSIIISLAICGLRMVSSKGMILEFLRMPYEWLLCEVEEISKFNKLHSIDSTLLETWKYKILIYILKPLIGCTTCMASVWTLIIEYSYFKLSWWSVITVFIVACMNSIIFALYEKLNK